MCHNRQISRPRISEKVSRVTVLLFRCKLRPLNLWHTQSLVRPRDSRPAAAIGEVVPDEDGDLLLAEEVVGVLDSDGDARDQELPAQPEGGHAQLGGGDMNPGGEIVVGERAGKQALPREGRSNN